MKIYYFKDPVGNFGDDLNSWLWDTLIPGYFDSDDTVRLSVLAQLSIHRCLWHGNGLYFQVALVMAIPQLTLVTITGIFFVCGDHYRLKY